jgi:hypothetical protein
MANYPLSFPAVSVATERLVLDKRQQAMESPFTYNVKVVHTASRWAVEWSFPRMTLPRAEGIVGWGLSLNGQVGTFRFYPNQTVRSALTGRTLAQPAYPYNRAVRIGGYAASALSTIRVGQWFTIGAQLLRVTEASAIADTAGQITVSFEPELRILYATGEPVEFVKPFGVFRLAASTSPTYTLDPDRRPDFGTIQAIESVAV